MPSVLLCAFCFINLTHTSTHSTRDSYITVGVILWVVFFLEMQSLQKMVYILIFPTTQIYPRWHMQHDRQNTLHSTDIRFCIRKIIYSTKQKQWVDSSRTTFRYYIIKKLRGEQEYKLHHIRICNETTNPHLNTDWILQTGRGRSFDILTFFKMEH